MGKTHSENRTTLLAFIPLQLFVLAMIKINMTKTVIERGTRGNRIMKARSSNL